MRLLESLKLLSMHKRHLAERLGPRVPVNHPRCLKTLTRSPPQLFSPAQADDVLHVLQSRQWRTISCGLVLFQVEIIHFGSGEFRIHLLALGIRPTVVRRLTWKTAGCARAHGECALGLSFRSRRPPLPSGDTELAMLGSSRCCHFHTFKRLICASPRHEGAKKLQSRPKRVLHQRDVVFGAKQVRAAYPIRKATRWGCTGFRSIRPANS